MKNKIFALLAVLIIMTVGFGCSLIDKASNNKGANDNSAINLPSDSTNPNDSAKTGVAECDEFLDLLNNDSKSADEDFLTRRIREFAINLAKESIKKNIEENQGDKEKIAKGCKDGKDKYLKEKENKNNKDQNSNQKSGETQNS